jgi:hemoglobin/transferrin/lactoferrin receptor protein
LPKFQGIIFVELRPEKTVFKNCFVRYLILIFLPFFVFITSNAQNIRVVNAATQKPVENVLVISKKYTSQTNAQGLVSLENIGKNETLLFQHSSFLKITTTLEKIKARGNVVELSEAPIKIDEVVVSASRWEQVKTEIPLKIQNISSSDILHAQPQTTADMLGSKGGVFIQKSQMGGGSPMIRGFSANRLLLVVDGIRMNNAIYRSGNLHNVISLDANSLEQTEVIFGPGTVIYGSDALGGVMSFSTLTPRLSTSDKTTQKGKILSRYSGVNREKMVHGHFSLGDKKWAALVSATFSDFDDLRMGSHGPNEYLRPEYVLPGEKPEDDQIIENENSLIQTPTGYNQFNLMGKLRYRPTEFLDLTLGIHHSQTSDIPRYDRLIVYKNNSPQYARWYYGPQKWSLFSGQLNYSREHLLFSKFNFLAGYQNYAESRNDRKLYHPVLNHRVEGLRIYSLNFDFGKTLNNRQELFYGAEVFYNHVGSTGKAIQITSGESTNISPRYPDGSEYSSLAGYLSWKLKLNEKFIFQAGGRITQTFLRGEFDHTFYAFPFDNFEMKNSALNGNAGLVWHPTKEWQINFNASTGFRSPNIDDVAKVFDSEPGNVVVPNPGLKPEYARNLEAGIIHNFSGKAKVEITVFYTNLKDAMVRRDFQLNGQDSIMYDGILSKVEALVNAESANIYGGSFSFEYIIAAGFTSRSELTFTRGKDSEDFPVRHVPPTFGRSHLLFEKESLLLDFFVEFNGKFDYEQLAPDEQDKPHLYAVDENGNPWSPGWWTINLKGNYQINNSISLACGMENILDKRYRTYSSGIVAPGRNYFISLGIHF